MLLLGILANLGPNEVHRTLVNLHITVLIFTLASILAIHISRQPNRPHAWVALAEIAAFIATICSVVFYVVAELFFIAVVSIISPIGMKTQFGSASEITKVYISFLIIMFVCLTLECFSRRCGNQTFRSISDLANV